jgi:hypothetical protein
VRPAIPCLISILIAAVATLGLAQAQYPPPVGNLSASVSTTTTAAGGDVLLTCTARDISGAPIAGQECTFTIESEPGTDAAVGSKVVTKVTNEAGVATTNLYTGTAPGVIVVRMTSGELSSVVLVNVSMAQPAPAMETMILPPRTGDGGLAIGR